MAKAGSRRANPEQEAIVHGSASYLEVSTLACPLVFGRLVLRNIWQNKTTYTNLTHQQGIATDHHAHEAVALSMAAVSRPLILHPPSIS
ncbi:hypothetical protein RirG_045120 [Rhizophagus irregularis DAOM 197198w]|uniref:Uncharacterized protein n=1 Tax=Rhizophagus irregularis (strain DAOM 197198w) TaxID=1432141 RepID=A0A015N7A2_RHIIW|nr:hypothetical protein RirG_045120 [Rhizophagus irregularis DAOM 197198w]